MQPNYPQQYAYPAAPQYPAQYPVAPGYPAAPQYPTQYPVAPYGAPVPPPVQPTAAGSLDGYYGQPSTGGGKAWSFHNRPNGTTYAGIIARPITDADISQQTDMTTGVPRTFRDGRPMFVMIVPLRVPQSPEFPDGVATWWVRGQARDELVRAMAEAGAPAGPPEAGAMVQVTKVGERQGRPGFNPAYQYRVVYTRPTAETAQVLAQPVPQTAPSTPVAGYPAGAMPPGYPVQQGPTPQGWPPVGQAQAAAFAAGGVPGLIAAQQQQQQQQQYGAPVPAQPVYPAQTAPPAPQVPAPAPQPAYAAAAAPAGQQPAGLSAENLALMARLTGQPVG